MSDLVYLFGIETDYAIDQKAYYTKSQAQNTKGGITYETAMSEYAMNYNPSTFDESAVG